MKQSKIFKSTIISALITTTIQASLLTYRSPDQITMQNSTFDFGTFLFMFFLNGLLVFPFALLVFLPIWGLLYEFKLFNFYLVLLTGILCSIAIAYALSTASSWSITSALGAGIIGSFISITTFFINKYLTKAIA
jgi:hypothetical protein